MDGIYLKPRYRELHGLRMPLGFPPESLAEAYEYVPRHDDIIVTTYPKCGTTWTQNILYMLTHDARPIGPEESLTTLFPHLEEVGKDVVAGLAAPRLIKTHLPLPIGPFNDLARFILVVRNPFDCVVSFFHHTRGFPRHYDFADGTFSDFFEVFLDGAVDFGDYFEHLESWLAVADRANVFLISYEQMLEDLPAAVAGMAAFVGEPARRVSEDPQLLAQVSENARFSSMARDQQRWSSARPADLPFVRRGVVGDWRQHFSVDQARRLRRKALGRLGHLAALPAGWDAVFRDVDEFCSGMEKSGD